MSVNLKNIFSSPAKTNGTYITDQRLTIDDTVGGVTFTDITDPNVTSVELDLQTAAVMCTFDDSAPTTTNGHQLNPGEKYTWSVARFNTAKFIRLTATSGVMHASPSMA